jgi:hypothetical protein
MGAGFIRFGRWLIEAATGVLIWRRPDPTAPLSLWRRAVLWALIRSGVVFVNIGAALP